LPQLPEPTRKLIAFPYRPSCWVRKERKTVLNIGKEIEKEAKALLRKSKRQTEEEVRVRTSPVASLRSVTPGAATEGVTPAAIFS